MNARPKRRWSAPAALTLTVVAVTLGVSRWVSAADHRDSMALAGDPAADIADVYSFRSPTDPDNLVLAMTVSGLIPPAEAGSTHFDRDVLYQFRIDNNGDAVEDLVIQGFVTGSGGHQVMHFRGPAAPAITGGASRVLRGAETGTVRVSNGAQATVAQRGGMKFFAGVRDDPFFFDLVRFQQIIGGTEGSFRDPGIDTFAGTNVLAIVIELPIASLGTSPDLKVWGTTSRAN